MLFVLNYYLIFVELKYFLIDFYDYVHYSLLHNDYLQIVHIFIEQHQTFNIIFFKHYEREIYTNNSIVIFYFFY